MKRENVGRWDSGLEKEQILETYSAQLQKSWNSTKVIFGINKNIEQKKYHRGATHHPQGWGHALPPLVRPLPRRPPGSLPVTIFCYMKSFTVEKIIRKLSVRNTAATRRNQSRAPAELFCRGIIHPGGGNHHHRHHQCSSHRERAISINIFTNTISSPNPSSPLVSNSCLKVRDWC